MALNQETTPPAPPSYCSAALKGCDGTVQSVALSFQFRDDPLGIQRKAPFLRRGVGIIKGVDVCGRYRLTAKERWLSTYFNIDPEDLEWAARWNVAPTQEVATVRQDRKEPNRTFKLMRWGLIPYWAKDGAFRASTINAVSETAAEKPAFSEPLRRRRCLIPADGFYEWKQTGLKQKQPYHIGLANDNLFALAGLWDTWNAPDGKVIESCTILTTEANALLKPIHTRMPVILKPDDYDRWLDPGVTNPARVADLLRPFDARLMRVYKVSAEVNRVENDGPECAKEIVQTQGEQASLF